MDQVMNAIHIVLSIFTMIGMGMYLVKIGWLKDEHSELLSRLVVKVALPCMIISNLFANYTRESLAESVVGIIIPLLSLLVTMGIGRVCAKVLRLKKGQIGVFTCMFTFSNSVFIGLPVSQALFGEGVTPYTLLYYISNTFIFWTIGYNLMRKDGGLPEEKADFAMVPKYLMAGKAAKTDPAYAPARAAIAKFFKVIPVPLLFFVGSVLLIVMGFRLPKFIADATGYVGKLVTPMSLFYTGMILYRMIKAGRIRWQRGYLWLLGGRFVVAPLLLLVSVAAVGLVSRTTGIEALAAPELMRNALLIQASMPCMSQTPIVAAASGSDEEYAAGGIAITTTMSLVFIPLYMYVIVALL